MSLYHPIMSPLHLSQAQCRTILLRLPFSPPPPLPPLRPKIRASPNQISQSQSSSTRPLTRISSNSMSQSNGGESEAAVEAKKPENDVLVQYVVLRRDLIDTWPTGSVVTQGCHAAVAAIWGNKEDLHTVQYCSPENIDSMHKVTLEVKGETQILNLSEKLIGGGIVHKLWIEQPENIPTSLATKPYPKSLVSSFFKKLKLCK